MLEVRFVGVPACHVLRCRSGQLGEHGHGNGLPFIERRNARDQHHPAARTAFLGDKLGLHPVQAAEG